MKHKNRNWMKIGTTILCTLALLFTVFSVMAIHTANNQIREIYKHPYQVAREASIMSSRVHETSTYLPSLLTMDFDDADAVSQTLNGRNRLQHASLEQIEDLYLGDPQDLVDLKASMNDLQQACTEVVKLCEGHTELETAMKLTEEKINPPGERVNQILRRITDSTNQTMLDMQNKSIQFGYLWMFGSIFICIMILVLAIYTYKSQQKKNQEIMYREQLFNLLAKNVDDVFFIYDCKAEDLEYVSENSERILGFKEKEFREDPDVLYRMLSPEHAERLRLLSSDGPLKDAAECELQLVRDGQTREIKMRLYPIREKNRVSRYIAVLSDETEAIAHRQALSDALLNAQQANDAKRDFLSRMSHEIRTPLNAIIGMTTIAASHEGQRERVKDCLEKISYSSKHLLALVNDVLDMSKIEDGKMAVALEPFDLRKLVESIVAIIYPQTVEKGQEFKVTVSELTSELLIGDALRMNQILLNLLSNALKFTPKGGCIYLEIQQLRVKNGKSHIRFIVQDTGIGMSEAFLSNLYTPFEQENHAVSQNHGGTGLGLSITKNLVSLMGGTISVHSKEGEGSTFSVDLMFDLPESAEQEKYEQLDPLNILVADYDQSSAQCASRILENLGMYTTWASSGREAVEMALAAEKEDQSYDVCFIDWNMPDMNGIEATRRIRQSIGPETLIIIISAYDFTPIEREAKEAGANAFILKPFFASSIYNTLLSVTQRDLTGSKEPAEKDSYDFRGKKILLAEDNALNMEIAVELLRAAGAAVDCAGDGRETVELFVNSQKDEYAMILMDIQMPVMNGYEAARQIRISEHPRAKAIPILAMTANAFSDDVTASLDAGMNGHIAKPIDVDVLYRSIAAHIKP